jgi:hypothetical protein
VKPLINQWFEQSVPFEGIQACCVRHVDQSSVSKSWADGYEDLAMDHAMRCVSDLFQMLSFHKVASGRLRWVYGEAVLHCERRADGTCLGVFTLRDEQSFDAEGLNRMFAEFQTLKAQVTTL